VHCVERDKLDVAGCEEVRLGAPCLTRNDDRLRDTFDGSYASLSYPTPDKPNISIPTPLANTSDDSDGHPELDNSKPREGVLIIATTLGPFGACWWVRRRL
jgi:hypothetical protein